MTPAKKSKDALYATRNLRTPLKTALSAQERRNEDSKGHPKKTPTPRRNRLIRYRVDPETPPLTDPNEPIPGPSQEQPGEDTKPSILKTLTLHSPSPTQCPKESLPHSESARPRDVMAQFIARRILASLLQPPSTTTKLAEICRRSLMQTALRGSFIIWQNRESAMWTEARV